MKRGFDLLLTIAVAPFALPVALAVAVLIYWRMGTPVLFTQTRAGLGGRPFRLYKFRTMLKAKSVEWNPGDDHLRLTELGRTLRRWSLDELPQIWNVAKGDMSWIGPRPLPVQYLPRYSQRQGKRHDVLPGVTGWAQVNGRNNAPWPERLEMDVWYAENRSLALDLNILWRTLQGVVSGRGVSAPDNATMTEFQGET